VALALEAAHIIPFFGGTSDHVTNGLLLRADIHTLFDLDVLGIDPDTLKIVIAAELQFSSYSELNGRRLAIPKSADHRPSSEALKLRWKQFCASGSS
jgi:predicted restriction endonuclease